MIFSGTDRLSLQNILNMPSTRLSKILSEEDEKYINFKHTELLKNMPKQLHPFSFSSIQTLKAQQSKSNQPSSDLNLTSFMISAMKIGDEAQKDSSYQKHVLDAFNESFAFGKSTSKTEKYPSLDAKTKKLIGEFPSMFYDLDQSQNLFLSPQESQKRIQKKNKFYNYHRDAVKNVFETAMRSQSLGNSKQANRQKFATQENKSQAQKSQTNSKANEADLQGLHTEKEKETNKVQSMQRSPSARQNESENVRKGQDRQEKEAAGQSASNEQPVQITGQPNMNLFALNSQPGQHSTEKNQLQIHQKLMQKLVSPFVSQSKNFTDPHANRKGLGLCHQMVSANTNAQNLLNYTYLRKNAKQSTSVNKIYPSKTSVNQFSSESLIKVTANRQNMRENPFKRTHSAVKYQIVDGDKNNAYTQSQQRFRQTHSNKTGFDQTVSDVLRHTLNYQVPQRKPKQATGFQGQRTQEGNIAVNGGKVNMLENPFVRKPQRFSGN